MNRLLLTLTVAGSLSCGIAHAGTTYAQLKSPWDITLVSATDKPYDCGPAIPVGPDITVTAALDSNKKHLSEDVKAAVYLQSSTALLDLTAHVVQAADTYRDTGSRAAAQCAANLIASAAYSHAMLGYMASNDAWEEHNHALRALAIAWLKVRNNNPVSPADNTAILQWLLDNVRKEREHWEHAYCHGHICNIKDHRGLSVAMAAAAVAVAADDDQLFHWSTTRYREAVSEINDRGMLHYDSHSRYAFLWNLQSAAYLVQIAELAEINNQPLYGVDDGTIHLLVHTVALGIISPAPFAARTHERQKSHSTPEPWEIAWASVYNRRFPDPVVTGLLHQIGPSGVDMWGGQPWDPEGNPE